MAIAVLSLVFVDTSPVGATSSVATSASSTGSDVINTVAGNGYPFGYTEGAQELQTGVPAYGLAAGSGNWYVSNNVNDGAVGRIDTSGTVHLFAGGAHSGFLPSPDNVPATRVPLGATWEVVDNAGDVFVNYLAKVRRIDHQTGIVTTIAGNGTSGYTGDNGPATQAEIDPRGLGVDAAGDVFMADYYDGVIREVNISGIITTVAGTGTPGFSGDNGPAIQAQISPYFLALDASGDIYFTDGSPFGGGRVRRIDHVTGVVTTVAGDGAAGYSGDGGPATSAGFGCAVGLAVTPAGDAFFVVDQCYGLTGRVREVTGGIITTVVGGGPPYLSPPADGAKAKGAPFFRLAGVAVDGHGTLFVSDSDVNRLFRVDSTTHQITTIAGNGVYVPINPTGGYAGDGLPAIYSQLDLGQFGSLSLDGAGDLFFAGGRIREVSATTGLMSTVGGGNAGDNVPATSAYLNYPRDLAVEADGSVLIADCGDGQVRRVDPSGTITVFAGEGSGANGIGDGGPANNAALSCPSGVAVVAPATGATGAAAPAAGTVYIADCLANNVRKVDPSGTITTAAGTSVAGYSGDGGPATQAQLNCPTAVAVDPKGDVFIADQNNNRVRKVTPSGQITTAAGTGVLSVGQNGVRATQSDLLAPQGVTVDSSGNLFISDGARISMVNTSGIITTVAGTGVPGYSGDGGPAVDAQVAGPAQAVVGADGTVTFADSGNVVVRSIAPGSPPPLPTSGCGQAVTKSITLTANLGPCPGDGLVVTADHVTVNLNGYQITATQPADPGGTRAGIRLEGVHNVTVTGGSNATRGQGQVSGFDAGIAIIGGHGNIVENMNVHDNLSLPPGGEFGDGIAMLMSSGNQLLNNTVNHNGVYDGISALGPGTDNNLVKSNVIEDNPSPPACVGTGLGIIMSSFLDTSLPRKQIISGNQIVGNTITNNANSGDAEISDTNSLIANNTITSNGLACANNGGIGFANGNGIGLTNTLLVTGGDYDTIENNQIHGNGFNGIVISTNNNQILNNNAANNNAARSGGKDLFDASAALNNPGSFGHGCNQNTWTGNTWGNAGYAPKCVTTGGSGPNPPASATAAPEAQPPVSAAPTPAPGPHPQRWIEGLDFP